MISTAKCRPTLSRRQLPRAAALALLLLLFFGIVWFLPLNRLRFDHLAMFTPRKQTAKADAVRGVKPTENTAAKEREVPAGRIPEALPHKEEPVAAEALAGTDTLSQKGGGLQEIQLGVEPEVEHGGAPARRWGAMIGSPDMNGPAGGLCRPRPLRAGPVHLLAENGDADLAVAQECLEFLDLEPAGSSVYRMTPGRWAARATELVAGAAVADGDLELGHVADELAHVPVAEDVLLAAHLEPVADARLERLGGPDEEDAAVGLDREDWGGGYLLGVFRGFLFFGLPARKPREPPGPGGRPGDRGQCGSLLWDASECLGHRSNEPIVP